MDLKADQRSKVDIHLWNILLIVLTRLCYCLPPQLAIIILLYWVPQTMLTWKAPTTLANCRFKTTPSYLRRQYNCRDNSDRSRRNTCDDKPFIEGMDISVGSTKYIVTNECYKQHNILTTNRRKHNITKGNTSIRDDIYKSIESTINKGN